MMSRVRLTPVLAALAVLIGLVGLVGPVGTPTVPAGATTAPPSRSTATLTMESEAMQAVNRVRARYGCTALRVTSSLRIAARRHSARMARRGVLSHQLAGEPGLARRVADAGYTGASMLGEVIAVGPTNGASAVRMWLASPKHRAILLDCRLRHVGAGVVRSGSGRHWWTVDLGRR